MIFKLLYIYLLFIYGAMFLRSCNKITLRVWLDFKTLINWEGRSDSKYHDVKQTSVALMTGIQNLAIVRGYERGH